MSDRDDPRVAIHFDERGNFSVYADRGVEVIVVSDTAFPDDRLFRMSPGPIPNGMLDGTVGFSGDGGTAETRLRHGLMRGAGARPFDVIDGGEA